MLDGTITDVIEAQSLSLQPQHIHIYSASWGPEDDGRTVDGPGILTREAFRHGVTKVTTDLYHQCTDKHTGTSASAPLAAGMIALALEANPFLTWRDMQHLVVRASRRAQLQAEDWRTNGVGRQVSHHYGYGLLDARLLVDLARSWLPTQPQKKCIIRVLHTPTPFDISGQGYNNWIFMSTHFWDEDPRGLWTLSLKNKGYYFNTGTLYHYTLLLYGTAEDMTARPTGPQNATALPTSWATSASLIDHHSTLVTPTRQ